MAFSYFFACSVLLVVYAERDSHPFDPSGNAVDNTWLMLRVTDRGVSIDEARSTARHPVSPAHAVSSVASLRESAKVRGAAVLSELSVSDAPSSLKLVPGGFWMAYEHAGSLHHMSFRNPRWMYYDWEHSELHNKSQHNGSFAQHDVGYELVVIPQGVSALRTQMVQGGPSRFLATARHGHQASTLSVPARLARHVLEHPRGRAALAAQTKVSLGANFTISTECTKRASCKQVGDFVVCTWKKVAPAHYPTLILMSSGYSVTSTGSEDARFCQDVAKVLTGTIGSDPVCPTSDVNANVHKHGLYVTEPWKTLSGGINIYSVFQASRESGASHPRMMDGTQCSYSGGCPTTKDNNLRCSYGAQPGMERALACSRKMVLALADVVVGPQDKMRIVLVNDEQHGGTGGSTVGAVNNGPTLQETFVHELAHSHAGLSDEYDYGIAESGTLSLHNCAPSTAAGQSQWARLILPNSVNDSSAVTASTPIEQLTSKTPFEVCSYTNYFKSTPSTASPTSQTYCNGGTSGLTNGFSNKINPSSGDYKGMACLMQSSKPDYCAACRQRIVETVLRNDPATGTAIAATTPRLPLQTETIHVTTASGSTYSSAYAFISSSLVLSSRRSTSVQLNIRWALLPQNTQATEANAAAAPDVPVSWNASQTEIAPSWRMSGSSFDTVCRADGVPLVTNDCDQDAFYVRRDPRQGILISGADLSCTSYPCERVVAAIVSDVTQPFVWALRSGTTQSYFDSVAFFRIMVHNDAGTPASWGCIAKDRGTEISNDNTLYSPSRTRWFPAYKARSNCTGDAVDPTCHVPAELLYCSTCDSGADCTLDLQTTDYKEPQELATDTLADWVKTVSIGVVVGIALTILAVIIIMYLVSRFASNEVGKDIHPLSCFAESSVTFIKLVLVLILILLVLLVIGAFYLYTQTTAELFGPNFVLLVIAMAVVVGTGCLFGIAAISALNRLLLLIFAILLFALLAFTVAVAVVLYMFAYRGGIGEDRLQTEWEDWVATRPKNICGFQRQFECSGFSHSCHNVAVPTRECSDYPSCSDPSIGSNYYTESCLKTVEVEITGYQNRAIIVTAVSFTFAGIVLITFILLIYVLFHIKCVTTTYRWPFVRLFLFCFRDRCTCSYALRRPIKTEPEGNRKDSV